MATQKFREQQEEERRRRIEEQRQRDLERRIQVSFRETKSPQPRVPWLVPVDEWTSFHHFLWRLRLATTD
jgi:hypothetical protein